MNLALVDMFAEVGVVSGALVAVSTLLVLAVRKISEFGHWLHEINIVVNRELSPNGGSSMKDQLTAVRVEQVRLQNTVDDHLADVAAHASDPTAHLRPSGPDGGVAGPR